MQKSSLKIYKNISATAGFFLILYEPHLVIIFSKNSCFKLCLGFSIEIAY